MKPVRGRPGATAVEDRATLRIHAFLPRSRANGPGLRAVLWLQGCSLGCSGCFNPETHASRMGRLVTVRTLGERIAKLRGELEGFTVSGGEPLQQPRPLAALLRRVRRGAGLSVVLFTGYAWDEVRCRPEAMAVLEHVDVLIAGRYERALRLASGLRGSANKTIHFLSDRYGPADLDGAAAAEVVISPNGEVLASGIDPLSLGPAVILH